MNAEIPKSYSAWALVFSWFFALLTITVSWAAMNSNSGLHVVAPLMHLGISGFEFTPGFFLDARNAPFLLLLGLCPPVVFTLLRDNQQQFGRAYYVCAFALIVSLVGVFTVDSLILFYVFWEAALIAVYFWIGLYGRTGFHVAAVYPILLRFVLFTLAGSLPMLISIAAVCAADSRDPGLSGLALVVSKMPEDLRLYVFAGFLIGFVVKLPLFGFHGWLRDTYNAAPPACRTLLSAAMSKMGAFGLIFILAPCFPGEIQHFAIPLQIIAVVGVIYGAMLTLAQERLIDVLIYGSLSHLSLLALGVFTAVGSGSTATTGLTGSILMVFNHGMIMVMLFALDARVLTDAESPDKGLLSGLRSRQPILAAFLLLSVFASASLPGLSNFPGELMIFFSAFKASPWLAFFAALGSLIGAAALMRMFHALFLGTRPDSTVPLVHLAPDLQPSEIALGLFIGALWLLLGFYPMLMIRPIEKALLVLQVFI